jgi:hypothetical protein
LETWKLRNSTSSTLNKRNDKRMSWKVWVLQQGQDMVPRYTGNNSAQLGASFRFHELKNFEHFINKYKPLKVVFDFQINTFIDLNLIS